MHFVIKKICLVAAIKKLIADMNTLPRFIFFNSIMILIKPLFYCYRSWLLELCWLGNITMRKLEMKFLRRHTASNVAIYIVI